MLDTPTADTTLDKLRNGLEPEPDIYAVEAELITLEGLRDALSIVRRSSDWPHRCAINAATALIDAIHEQVDRVRAALEESIEKGKGGNEPAANEEDA
jgi:hypothetical protein